MESKVMKQPPMKQKPIYNKGLVVYVSTDSEINNEIHNPYTITGIDNDIVFLKSIHTDHEIWEKIDNIRTSLPE